MTKDTATADSATTRPESNSLPVDPAPKTLSVPAAGRQYFGLGKNASYGAAKRGELPVIKIGRRLRVSVVALERKLAAPSNRDNQSE